MEQVKRDLHEQVTEIEANVCDFFALTYEEVYSKNLKRDLVLARHFMIYILHTHYGISAHALSKIYNHSARHIKRICASIRNYIQFDKKYKNYYECLMVYIKREAN